MSGNTSRKRTIRQQIERAKAHNLVDQEFDFWVNESGTMDEEAHCYMLQKHFKRVRREENQPSIRMSMLEDSHASHKTERVKRVCQDLNVQLCIISGGLTADAQLADRVYIRRLKRIHRAKLLRLLLNKWRLQKKRLTNKDGVVHRPHVLRPDPPTRIEQINLICQAWRETYTDDIDVKTDEVKMKSYALAQLTGWTPEKAFEGIVDEEQVAQAVSEIARPALDCAPQQHANLKCVYKKCARIARYNYSTETLPSHCTAHRLEGMVEIPCTAAVPAQNESKVDRTQAMQDKGNLGPKRGKKGKPAAKPEKGKPGRPTLASQIAVKKEGQKHIQAFFSPHPIQTQPVNDEPSVLEYKLMHVDGLSRTEARHMSLAIKASLGEEVKGENDTAKVNERGGEKGLPNMLLPSYADSIPPEHLVTLHAMWGREGVVVDGGAGARDGLQLKHADLARLLTLADSVDGWLNDTCMDYVGKLVNSCGSGAYAFTTYLRECFLLGMERGGRAIRKVVKKAWTTKQGGKGVVIPDIWLFPMTKQGDPHWWLLFADVDQMCYHILDPFSPNTEAPKDRVAAGQELLAWVLQVLFNNKQKTIDDFQFYPSYLYTLPVQRDGYNCGIYVALYMAMIAQNNIQYTWPQDMQQFRYKLALAIEHNDVDYFFKRPEPVMKRGEDFWNPRPGDF